MLKVSVDPSDDRCMEDFTSTVRNLWNNGWVRYSLILGCVGFVPFWFLSLAMATIR